MRLLVIQMRFPDGGYISRRPGKGSFMMWSWICGSGVVMVR